MPAWTGAFGAPDKVLGMAKKKRVEKKARRSLAGISSETLAAQGRLALEEKKFSQAVDVFKNLLKRERKREWLELLGRAYAGRALRLAEKGLFVEAAAIWDNMARACPDFALGPDLKIAWLMNAGRHLDAAAFYGERIEEVRQGTMAGRIDACLAGLILGGRDDILHALPPASPLVSHLPPVKQALAAYAAGRTQETDEWLRQIPFRSPYRDFRLILKALLDADRDRTAAVHCLRKIDPASPFGVLASLLETGLGGGAALAARYSGLTGHEREFVVSLLGLGKAQAHFLAKAASVQKDPAGLFALLTDRKCPLAKETVRAVCYRALPYTPAGIGTYQRLFGPLAPFDEDRIRALAMERQGRTVEAVGCWRSAVANLQRAADDGSNRLRIALIYRRMARLAMAEEAEGGPAALSPLWMDPEAISPSRLDPEEFLKKSLDFDPADKETYTVLLERSKDTGRSYGAWLNRALHAFPRDNDFLLAAMEAALETGAFKKASRFAARLLAIDPINSRVHRLLVDAHLSHGRKLAAKNRYSLARKEFGAGSAMERPGERSGLCEIAQGLLDLAEGRPESGERLLAEGRALAGGGVPATAAVAVEARLLGLPRRVAQASFSELAAAAGRRPTKDDVLALLGLINRYASQKVKGLWEMLAPVEPFLANAAALGFNRDEMHTFCDFFMRHGRFTLLERFARRAEMEWPDTPAFVFSAVLGGARGDVSAIGPDSMLRLLHAAKRAGELQDFRTVQSIERFFDFPYFADPFHDLDGLDPEEFVRDFFDLFDTVPGKPSRCRGRRGRPRRTAEKSGGFVALQDDGVEAPGPEEEGDGEEKASKPRQMELFR